MPSTTPADTRLSDADIIRIGTAIARASYGGSTIASEYQGTWREGQDTLNYDDSYREYIASLSTSSETWKLLDQNELGSLFSGGANFTAGGDGEALVVERTANGQRAAIIAFRYLNMEHLKENKKQALRIVRAPTSSTSPLC